MHKIVVHPDAGGGSSVTSLGGQMYSHMIDMAEHGHGKEAEQTQLLMAGITDWGGNLAHWNGQVNLGPTHGQFDKAMKQGLLTIHDKIDEEAGKYFFGLGRLFDGQYKDRADKFVPPLMEELIPNIGKTANVSGRIKNAIISKFGAMATEMAHQNIKTIIDQQAKLAEVAAQQATEAQAREDTKKALEDAKKVAAGADAPKPDDGKSWQDCLKTIEKTAVALAPKIISAAEPVADVFVDKKIKALTEHMKSLSFQQLMHMDVSKQTMMKYFADPNDNFPGSVSEATYAHEVGSLTAKVHQIGKPVIAHMKAQKEKEIRALAEPLIEGCLKDDKCTVPTKQELKHIEREAAHHRHRHGSKTAKAEKAEMNQSAPRILMGRGGYSTP